MILFLLVFIYIKSELYEFTTNLESEEYVIQFEGTKIQYGTVIVDDSSKSPSFKATGSKNENKHPIKIIRKSNNFDSINLQLDEYENDVNIDFECDEKEADKHFLYTISLTSKGNNVRPSLGTCSNVEIVINKPKDDEKPPDVEKPTDDQKPPDVEKPTDDQKPPDVEKPTDDQKPPDVENPTDDQKPPNDESSMQPLTQTPSRSIPPQIIMDEIVLQSKTINLTSNGFIDGREDVSVDIKKMNKIRFTDSITVYENDELKSNLYFSAMSESGTIIIDKEVKKSNITVITENSPQVQIQKVENPLSFFHDNEEGGKASIKSNEFDNLILNDVDDRNGDFSLYCDELVQSVSLSKINMSFISSFSIKKSAKDEAEKKRILEENTDGKFADVDILVRDRIEINSYTNAVLNNFNLSGKLSMHDDSTLIVTNDAVFTEKSKIDFIFNHQFNLNEKSKEKIEPAINIHGKLIFNSSEIILSSNEKTIDVVDFPLLLSDDLGNCYDYVNLFAFEQKKEGEIRIRCESDDDGNDFLLLLTANGKNKEKKKLSAGVIAGLVIAAVFVVGMIIALVIFYVRKNKQKHKSTLIKHDEDSSSVGL